MYFKEDSVEDEREKDGFLGRREMGFWEEDGEIITMKMRGKGEMQNVKWGLEEEEERKEGGIRLNKNREMDGFFFFKFG